jgi:hypothetical protein
MSRKRLTARPIRRSRISSKHPAPLRLGTAVDTDYVISVTAHGFRSGFDGISVTEFGAVY